MTPHSKAKRERKQHNAWKREMRRRFGVNWRTQLGFDKNQVVAVPSANPVRQMTVEEMRASMRRANPRPTPPAYIEGVSPNA